MSLKTLKCFFLYHIYMQRSANIFILNEEWIIGKNSYVRRTYESVDDWSIYLWLNLKGNEVKNSFIFRAIENEICKFLLNIVPNFWF